MARGRWDVWNRGLGISGPGYGFCARARLNTPDMVGPHVRTLFVLGFLWCNLIYPKRKRKRKGVNNAMMESMSRVTITRDKEVCMYM